MEKLEAIPNADIINSTNGLVFAKDTRDSFVTETGIVFKLHKVRGHIMVEAMKKLHEPIVPIIHDDERDRDIENPNDPDYQAAMQEFRFTQGMLGININITLGTSVVTIPDDVCGPDSEDWSNDIEEVAGIEIPKHGKARYTAWLRFYVLTDTEISDLFSKIVAFSGGTLEAEVDSAVDSFRSDEAGSSNQPIPIKAAATG